MDDALADWLGLREAHDWAARDDGLVSAIVGVLPQNLPLRVLDLGTGTGSNLRYLLTRLPGVQEWLLVDKSPDVIDRIAGRTREWAARRDLDVDPLDAGFKVHGDAVNCRVHARQLNLDLPLDESMFHGRHLVTASALLDLVSDVWLEALATACRNAGAAVLFALTYDGATVFEPRDDQDDVARNLLNAHQLRDKGLGGPALGPGAHARAMHWFRQAGFEVRDAATDWDVSAGAREFQRELIDGLAAAASDQDPQTAAVLAAWQQRRLAHLDAGRSRVIVGHRDLAAWPRSR